MSKENKKTSPLNENFTDAGIHFDVDPNARPVDGTGTWLPRPRPFGPDVVGDGPHLFSSQHLDYEVDLLMGKTDAGEALFDSLWAWSFYDHHSDGVPANYSAQGASMVMGFATCCAAREIIADAMVDELRQRGWTEADARAYVGHDRAAYRVRASR